MRWLVLAVWAVSCAKVPDAGLFGPAADAASGPADVASDAAGGDEDRADLSTADAMAGEDAEIAVELDGDAANGADGGAPVCGNSVCEVAENPGNCPADCPAVCGDGLCSLGEDPVKCNADCCGTCGDGKCMSYSCKENDPKGPYYCDVDCALPCGDGVCGASESPMTCSKDGGPGACGNHLCEFAETAANCPEDCPVSCGNGVCETSEVSACPVDCGFCGDTVCAKALGETEFSCPGDCKITLCKGNEDCADGNDCTFDYCGVGGQCKHQAGAGACDDGDACTVDLCDSGGCKSLPIPTMCKDIYDAIECTTSACDSKVGCVQVPDSTSCVDENPCTNGVCDINTGCVMVPNTATCTDNDACTAGDSCKDGACNPGSAVKCDDNNACTNDSCSAKTGCVNLANTATCEDGSACTNGDVCGAGICAGKAINCQDGNACTSDGCDPKSGCVNLPLVATCEDGNACTTGDACSEGVCQGGATACGNGKCDCGEMAVSCPTDCSPSAGMVLIPGGTFWMGCNSVKDGSCILYANESPQHKVTLSSYYMDITETTVGQYKACVDAGGCTAPSSVQPTQYATYPSLTNNPVNFVTWLQSQAYCQWRGTGFDLPTEAQWEMAARGSCEKNGSTAGDAGCASAMRTYPWGEAAATCSYAVMSDGGKLGCGTNTTWAVGSKPAGDSPYGLHDMAGNVWERTRDWYGTYSPESAVDPVGPGSASSRVSRGGCFGYDAAGLLRAGIRSDGPPSGAFYNLGLRCVRAYP